MPLSPGSRLGAYEVVAPLGVGGMGEVYRARDTRLGRDVALKVLPAQFALDPERLARFTREAQVLAALNHPGIAAIYGIEDHALVLELVDGPTVADRIARGRIDLDEALPIARQIADGLEAAHEQGIIHRDLKPANIKVRPDGTVKVLDFGLAKLAQAPGPGPQASVSALTLSPTITTPAMTQVGMILGTAAYMSPEQAKGREADKRSDIWAFGCVLFEMLTGKRAFEGDDVSDTLAAVLRAEPDWTRLPADTPPRIRTLLERCLQKNVQKRLSHIAIARHEIEEALTDPAAPASVETVGRAAWWTHVIPSAAAAAVGAALAATVMFSLRPSITSPVVTRVALALDPSTVFTSPFQKSVALSPDGTRLVYVANRRLYVRSMSDFEPRAISGSESQAFIGAPEFSPDSGWLVFWSGSVGGRENVLKKVAVGGGTAVTLAHADNPFGLTWDNSGIIYSERGKRILRLSQDGGEPKLLVDLKGDEIASGPQMLPDEQTLLFTLSTEKAGWDNARIVVQSLKSGMRKTVVPRGTAARYLPTGHLVYAVGGVLFAVAFDVRRLEAAGGAIPVVEGVQRTSGNAQVAFDAQYSASRTGSLVYLPGPANAEFARRFDLAWTYRSGSVEPLRLAANAYENPRVSPDGTRLAFGVVDDTNADIYVHDLSGSSAPRRLTFGGHNRFPVWAPDSQHVAFQSDREGDAGIFWQRADISGTAERLTTADRDTSHIPDSWSPKGDILLFDVSKNSNVSLWTLSVADHKVARLSGPDSGDPIGAVFSPDGQWVAYTGGRRPGAHYIYVQPYPTTGEQNVISVEADDGHHPAWSPDGKQLFFIGPGRFVAIDITTRPKFGFGVPTMIPRGFTEGNAASSVRSYDVSPNGQRFIGVVQASDPRPDVGAGPRLLLVTNWFEELKQKVPTEH